MLKFVPAECSENIGLCPLLKRTMIWFGVELFMCCNFSLDFQIFQRAVVIVGLFFDTLSNLPVFSEPVCLIVFDTYS